MTLRAAHSLALVLATSIASAVAGASGETPANRSPAHSLPEPVPNAYPPSRTFVGTSPCGEAIRSALVIEPGASCDIVSWKLVLYEASNPEDGVGNYDLTSSYGSVRQGKPGIAKGTTVATGPGTWRAGRVMLSSPRPTFILDGGLQLAEVNDRLLHFLDSNGRLMVGDGGWSYTLNSLEHRERRKRRYGQSQPDMSYPIFAPATGPTVFGIFEGRTPCQGIARQLGIAVQPECEKAKWRVTLFQDARTSAPTTYRIEGSLHVTGARVGQWSTVRGTPGDPQAVVYELAPPADGEPLRLLKGDDNVLFFVDEQWQPRLGDGDFSYTLNRRNDSQRSAGTADRDITRSR